MGWPVCQRGIRRRQEEPGETVLVAREPLGHLRKTLVDPRFFARVARPVGCVLQLVGQRTKVDRGTQGQAAEVHVHHLSLIAVWVHLRRVVVRGVEVAHSPSEACVEDGDTGFITLAGSPLAAEAGGHHRIDGVLEGPGRPAKGLLRGAEASFKVPVGVLAHVSQHGLDPVHVLVNQINDPELVQPAHLVLDWVRGSGGRLAGAPDRRPMRRCRSRRSRSGALGRAAGCAVAVGSGAAVGGGVREGEGVSRGLLGDGAARGVGLGPVGGAGVVERDGATVAGGVAVGCGEAAGAGVQPNIRRRASRATNLPGEIFMPKPYCPAKRPPLESGIRGGRCER